MMKLESSDSLIIEESERDTCEELIEKISSLKNIYSMIKDGSCSIEFNIDIESLQNEIKEEQSHYNDWWNNIYKKYNLDTNEKYTLMFEDCTLNKETKI